MKKIIIKFCLALLLVSSLSCERNSEDDLIDFTPPPPSSVINYVDNIKPIIDANCLACHGNPTTNGAPNSLVSYNDVRQSTENNLILRISLPGAQNGSMPPGTGLPQPTVDLIQQWADEGYAEGPNEEVSITYTNTVKAVIDNNCIGCHGNPPVNGAPNSLVSYNEVRQSTQNNLIERISLQIGETGAMPPGNRLPQAVIDAIQEWANNGYEE